MNSSSLSPLPSGLPQRDRSRQLAPQVFEQLREQIIALELPPGTVLSRVELQLRFGLSSTPIRDALLRLQEEALVDVFPQHATIVSPINLELAHQAQFLRRAVELEIIHTLAQKPDAMLIARLRDILAMQARLAAREDYAGHTQADRNFHHCMYEAAGAPDLWQLVRSRSGHIDRLRRLHLPTRGKADEIIRDHTAIVDALEAGDAAAAQQHLRDHLSRSLAFSETMRTQYPNYF